MPLTPESRRAKSPSKNTPDASPSRFTRSGEIARLMRRLDSDGYPRVQMSLLVAAPAFVDPPAIHAIIPACFPFGPSTPGA